MTVTIGGSTGRLCIRLSMAGLDPAAEEQILAGARDRIVALNGSVRLASVRDRTTIEAAIPCAS